MIPGEIVLLRLPQPDLLPGKLRLVLVLSALPGPFGDVLVCGVSSQWRQEIPQWDERLSLDEPDFATSGLKVASVIRLNWLAAVNPNVSAGTLGFIGEDRLLRLRQRLAAQLDLPPQ
jgi:mRNA interferase MazF